MQKKWSMLGTLSLGALAILAVLTGSHHLASAQGTERKAAKPKASKMQSEENPFVCNLAAMTPAERAHYETQKKRLRGAIKETKELPTGYAFRFASEPNLLVAAAEFIEGERQCCAFYTFNLEVTPNNSGIWMRITGPRNTKEFIKDALAL